MILFRILFGFWPWGEAWSGRRYMAPEQPCEFCKQVARRVRCQGCCRDLCARCLAVPNCDHAENGIHQEGGA